MNKKRQAQTEKGKETKRRTPTFLLELPLQVNESQATRLRAHLEAGRQLYNALLSEGQRRLRKMRADPAWHAARALPRFRRQERAAAFGALRQQYGFSAYALHAFAKTARVSWLADHLDAVLGQTLATRAYRALNRVCLGEARRVRFKSRGRGLGSIENKRNDTGLRFVLQEPEEGHQGFLIWHTDHLLALIDWNDPLIKHGLDQRVKYARLVQRQASSQQAQGADRKGSRYFVQLVLQGIPYRKPKHTVGTDIIGADLGPSSIALVAREGDASLSVFCEELTPAARAIRRLQRKMDRQRRAADPDNYDGQGRIKKQGKRRPGWKTSKGYQQTRRRKAEKERKLAAHRKSLHGKKVHEIIAVGTTIILEKISYRGWQKQYGKSVGLRAPGMFVEVLRRTVASTGGTLIARSAAKSQTLPVLPWLRQVREKAALAAVPSVPLRHRSRAEGPVFRVSGLNPGSRSSQSLVCPGCHFLGSGLRRGCGPHTNGCSNGRKRGSPCLEALVSPEPEPVGLKV
jgi:hypothetical protein